MPRRPMSSSPTAPATSGAELGLRSGLLRPCEVRYSRGGTDVWPVDAQALRPARLDRPLARPAPE
eukprot:5946164-Alexandrium_andersonii.AAC.1